MNGYGEFGSKDHKFKGVWKNNYLINKGNYHLSNKDDSNDIMTAMISLTKFPIGYTLRTVTNTIEPDPDRAVNIFHIEDEEQIEHT